MKIFKPLTLSLVLSAMFNSANAQDFSQTIFFSDSLSDTGRLTSFIQNDPIGGFLFGSSLSNSFTTNPDTTWAGVLANSYGLNATANDGTTLNGTNYAVGSAQSTQEVTFPMMSFKVPSVSQQIESYLSLAKQADPNALYTVWIGANDLLTAADNPSTAPQTIIAAAQGTVASVERLNQAGANYILVPNLPDVGLTERFQKKTESEQQQATQAAQLYNMSLYRGLNNTQANIIPLNTFALLQEAVSRPEAFGFKVTNQSYACQTHLITSLTSLACNENRLVEESANQTYIFADEIHPSGKTHRLLAQYARSVIEAPSQIAALSNTILAQGNTQQQSIQRRLTHIKPTENNWWIDGEINKTEINSAQSDPINSELRIGADIAKGGHNIGLYAQLGQQKWDINQNNAKVKQAGFGIYHQYQQNQWKIQGQVGIDHLDIENTRKIDWEGETRQHTANGDGQRLQASMRGSYNITQNKLTYSPYLGVNYQHLTIGDLLEDQSNLSTAMKFKEHSQTSLQGEIGLNIGYNINPKGTIYGGLGITHEFNDDNLSITATLPSIAQYQKGFTMPIKNDREKTAINTHLGVAWQLHPKITLSSGIQAQKAGSDIENIGGFIGLNGSF